MSLQDHFDELTGAFQYNLGLLRDRDTELATLEQATAAKTRQLRKRDMALSGLKVQLAEQAEHATHLQAAVSELQARATAAEQAHAQQVRVLRAEQAATLEAAADSAARQLAACRAAELQQQHAHQAQVSAELQRQHAQHVADMQAQRQQHEATLQEQFFLAEQAQAAHAEAQRARSMATTQLQALQEDLATLTDRCASAEAHARSQSSELHTLQVQLAAVEAQHAWITEQRTQAHSLALAQIQSDLQAARERAQQAEAALASATETWLAQRTTLLHDATVARTELVQVQRTSEQTNTALEEFRSQSDDQLRALQADLALARTENAGLRDQVHASEEAADAQRGIVVGLKTQLARGLERENELKCSLTQQSLAFERRLQQTVLGADHEKDALTQQLLVDQRQHEGEIARLEHDITQYKRVLADMQDSLQTATLAAAAVDPSGMFKRLQEQNAALRQTVQSLQQGPVLPAIPGRPAVQPHDDTALRNYVVELSGTADQLRAELRQLSALYNDQCSEVAALRRFRSTSAHGMLASVDVELVALHGAVDDFAQHLLMQLAQCKQTVVGSSGDGVVVALLDACLADTAQFGLTHRIGGWGDRPTDKSAATAAVEKMNRAARDLATVCAERDRLLDISNTLRADLLDVRQQLVALEAVSRADLLRNPGAPPAPWRPPSAVGAVAPSPAFAFEDIGQSFNRPVNPAVLPKQPVMPATVHVTDERPVNPAVLPKQPVMLATVHATDERPVNPAVQPKQPVLPASLHAINELSPEPTSASTTPARVEPLPVRALSAAEVWKQQQREKRQQQQNEPTAAAGPNSVVLVPTEADGMPGRLDASRLSVVSSVNSDTMRELFTPLRQVSTDALWLPSPLSEDDTRPAARDPKVSTSAKIPSFRGTGRRRIRNYNVRDDANNTDEDDEGRL